MNPETYLLIKFSAGAVATLGLYSVLYRENKFYRFFEHIFLGLASGWALKVLWTDTLSSQWWDKMLGKAADASSPGQVGYWAYIFLLPIGLMAYFVFSKKHNWLSRIPIGVIIGLYSGQQIQIWWNRFGPQIDDSIKPIIPNTFGQFTKAANALPTDVSMSQALSNIIFLVTLLSVIFYFLFSFKQDAKWVQRISTTGRWLLMIGFGAIFGSTVMMRFTLLIDRMYFIWIEWLQHSLLHK